MPVRPDTDELIAFLDSLARLDPLMMGRLVSARVPCNERIRDHPTVQTGSAVEFRSVSDTGSTSDDQEMVGILGVLNGYCGVYSDGTREGWGPISARLESDGRVSGFFRTPNPPA